MKCLSFYFYLSIALAVSFLWPTSSSAGKDDQADLRKLFERAQNIGDIRAAGSPGFRMMGDVRLWVKKGTPMQGKYLLIWRPDGNWREELRFNGYKRVRVGNEKQFWQVRSTETENAQIFGFDEVMNLERGLKIEEGDKLKRLPNGKIDGVVADCVRHATAGSLPRTYCFSSSSGELLGSRTGSDSMDVPWRVAWEEYSEFQQWAGKGFPRLLRGFNGKQLVVEVRLDEITPLPQLPLDYFRPPNDATIWGHCTGGEMWKLKHSKVPEYPSSERNQGRQGMVSLYARIEDDGHVSNLRLVNSPDPILGQSAEEAISQWRYEKTAGCLNSTGPAEKLIDVIFSLGR
ncbi:MAG: energy transducer TonB [Terracidiphilus sp.]